MFLFPQMAPTVGALPHIWGRGNAPPLWGQCPWHRGTTSASSAGESMPSEVGYGEETCELPIGICKCILSYFGSNRTLLFTPICWCFECVKQLFMSHLGGGGANRGLGAIVPSDPTQNCACFVLIPDLSLIKTHVYWQSEFKFCIVSTAMQRCSIIGPPCISVTISKSLATMLRQWSVTMSVKLARGWVMLSGKYSTRQSYRQVRSTKTSFAVSSAPKITQHRHC